MDFIFRNLKGTVIGEYFNSHPLNQITINSEYNYYRNIDTGLLEIIGRERNLSPEPEILFQADLQNNAWISLPLRDIVHTNAYLAALGFKNVNYSGKKLLTLLLLTTIQSIPIETVNFTGGTMLEPISWAKIQNKFQIPDEIVTLFRLNENNVEEWINIISPITGIRPYMEKSPNMTPGYFLGKYFGIICLAWGFIPEWLLGVRQGLWIQLLALLQDEKNVLGNFMNVNPITERLFHEYDYSLLANIFLETKEKDVRKIAAKLGFQIPENIDSILYFRESINSNIK